MHPAFFYQLFKVCLSSLLVFVCLESALAKNEREGRVLRLRGKVITLSPHTRKKIFLKKGDLVKGNVLISTGHKSFIKIKFEDGSLVSLGPESRIVLSQRE